MSKLASLDGTSHFLISFRSLRFQANARIQIDARDAVQSAAHSDVSANTRMRFEFNYGCDNLAVGETSTRHTFLELHRIFREFGKVRCDSRLRENSQIRK